LDGLPHFSQEAHRVSDDLKRRLRNAEIEVLRQLARQEVAAQQLHRTLGQADMPIGRRWVDADAAVATAAAEHSQEIARPAPRIKDVLVSQFVRANQAVSDAFQELAERGGVEELHLEAGLEGEVPAAAGAVVDQVAMLAMSELDASHLSFAGFFTRGVDHANVGRRALGNVKIGQRCAVANRAAGRGQRSERSIERLKKLLHGESCVELRSQSAPV
jgi:hypothetical protein